MDGAKQLVSVIEETPALGLYELNFEHVVIAENQFGKEALLAIRHIVSTLFLAEVYYDLPVLYCGCDENRRFPQVGSQAVNAGFIQSKV